MRRSQRKNVIFYPAFRQELRKTFTGAVGPFGPDKVHSAAKSGQVGRYVCGPAKTVGPALDFYHRNGGFRRDSSDPSPKVAIEHYVAYYKRADFLESGKIERYHQCPATV
jgi:hypothetical protein